MPVMEQPLVNFYEAWKIEDSSKSKMFLRRFTPYNMQIYLSEKKLGVRCTLRKGYFPHFFIRKENQHYAGPLPLIENYDPDGMSTKERQEFLRWCEELTSAEYD